MCEKKANRAILYDYGELASGAYHVLHFDGQGGFGRLCRGCQTLNDAEASACEKSQADLEQLVLQGYRLFEDKHCAKELVSSEEVGNAVQGTPLRLIFLSACQSAVPSRRAGQRRVFSSCSTRRCVSFFARASRLS